MNFQASHSRIKHNHWSYYCISTPYYHHVFFCVWHMVAEMVEVLCYKPEGHGFETQWGNWILSIYLIPPTAPLVPESEKMFLGCVSRLSGQCGIPNFSQSDRPPQPVMGIILFFLFSLLSQFWQIQFSRIYHIHTWWKCTSDQTWVCMSHKLTEIVCREKH
jgi:hypothetical protein